MPTTLTRVALIYNPDTTKGDPATIQVPIDTKAALPVELQIMSKTNGQAIDAHEGGSQQWNPAPTLAAGVYGFTTTAQFVVTNPNPHLLAVVLASGKDPWPTPPPPPRAWTGVSQATFNEWFAGFLMAAGDFPQTGLTISVEPFEIDAPARQTTAKYK